MAEEVSPETHIQLAKTLFNKTWDYLDKPSLTEKQQLDMIHTAHASRYHWGQAGEPMQHERGEWQISRVYSTLGRPEPALYHAQRCLEICQENDLKAFELAFAYEAMTRAYGVAGDEVNQAKYHSLARSAGERIEDEANREYFMGELESVGTS